MGRIRSVSPDICTSQMMARLSAECERTFVRLWTACDDEGRCEDRPKLLKATLYPEHDEITAEQVDEELEELAAKGMIYRYQVDSKRYLQVRSWSEYQHPRHPSPSKFPPFTAKADIDAPMADTTAAIPRQSASLEWSGVEYGVELGDGVEGNGAENFNVSSSMLQWASKYCVNVDVELETKRFVEYYQEKKTLDDPEAGWRGWMRRAQDKTKSAKGATSYPKSKDPLESSLQAQKEIMTRNDNPCPDCVSGWIETAEGTIRCERCGGTGIAA